MSNVLETLRERGFVQQCTDEEAVARLLSGDPVTYYVGFDPTADSLHIGSLLPIMAMAHLQRAGHRPIALVGGGTAMVGDPSGKTELRRIMPREEIEANGRGILSQLQRYLNVDGASGLFANNADWLLQLGYIEFLRDIGRHFRVNEMVKAEAYRQRMEREEGLSFIEFNYQLLQAYDFLHLAREHGCSLQMGGDDQWGNILAGVDLTRRVASKTVFGLTFPLLTTARGEKMGKTAQGAVWLSAARTSAYEFYQYWINTDDRDAERFLALFTFLPIDEVRRLGALPGAEIRQAKEVLAFEATRLSHGEAEAQQARESSRTAFGGGDSGQPAEMSAIPTTTMEASLLEAGISVVDLLVQVGLTSSKAEARRLIGQGGAYVNGAPIAEVEAVIGASHVESGAILLRAGKKRYHRLLVR